MIPEYGIHLTITLILLVYGLWISAAINVPLIIYHAWRLVLKFTMTFVCVVFLKIHATACDEWTWAVRSYRSDEQVKFGFLHPGGLHQVWILCTIISHLPIQVRVLYLCHIQTVCNLWFFLFQYASSPCSITHVTKCIQIREMSGIFDHIVNYHYNTIFTTKQCQ